jgi:hypothetical protein
MLSEFASSPQLIMLESAAQDTVAVMLKVDLSFVLEPEEKSACKTAPQSDFV